jgi:type VI secretion system protein ImpC
MARDRFMLAVLGDFGGTPRAAATRRFLAVDRDNLEEVMARLDVSFEATVPNRLIPGSDAELRVALRIGCLEDFHPERIAPRVPALATLLQARSTVPDPATLAALGITAPPPEPEARPRESGSLLDQIVGGTATPGPTRARPPLDPVLERFVQAITEPIVDRTDRATLAAWREAVDALVGRQTREILYHPRFQAMEAAWRALADLVMKSERGPDLAIHVLDLPKLDLARDLAGPDESVVARLLCEEGETPGGTPFAAIVADYAFGPHEIDLTLLEVLGAVARRAGAPFIASARPALLGVGDVRELADSRVRARLGKGEELTAWRDFRASPEARQIMLCLPRVLLRLPYGPQGEPVTTFTFDEALVAADHARYLWGSPALAFGQILTRAFAREGWGMEPTADAVLRGLPLHVYREDGEPRALPCAEVLMTEQTIERVMEEGLVVLASYKDRDEARFCGVATVAGTSIRLGRGESR